MQCMACQMARANSLAFRFRLTGFGFDPRGMGCLRGFIACARYASGETEGRLGIRNGP